jgi:toxin ParE1/3/4
VKEKRLVFSIQARKDVEAAIDYYLDEDSEQAALGLIDALEKAYVHISRQPGTGSSRYAHEVNLPGLRSWPLTRYPHLIFYVEHAEHIDVWRVLHGARDIAAWLQKG